MMNGSDRWMYGSWHTSLYICTLHTNTIATARLNGLKYNKQAGIISRFYKAATNLENNKHSALAKQIYTLLWNRQKLTNFLDSTYRLITTLWTSNHRCKLTRTTMTWLRRVLVLAAVSSPSESSALTSTFSNARSITPRHKVTAFVNLGISSASNCSLVFG